MAPSLWSLNDIPYEELEWLRSFFRNSLEKSKTSVNEVYLKNIGHIVAWDKMLHEATPARQLAQKPLPKSPRAKRAGTPARGKKTKSSSQEVTDPFVCPNHPLYKGERSPRTDCDQCWDIYKTLQGPERFSLARAKFTRRQQKLGDTSTS